MKERKLFSLLAFIIIITMIISFSFIGCKAETAETAGAVEETMEPVEEETAAEVETEEEIDTDMALDQIAVKAAKEIAEAEGISEINVLLTWDAPGEALEIVMPIWEEATGIKVNYERLSTLEISQKIQLELTSGGVQYDLFQYDGYLRKPLLENPNTLALDDLMAKYDPQWDTIIPGMKEFGMNDAGEQKAIVSYWCDYMMVYRSDLMDDPAEHEAFEAKYGYDYDMWDLDWDTSFKDLAEFFTRDTDGNGQIDIWGIAELGAQYAAGDCFMGQYLNRFQWEKPYLFDVESGKCTLDDEYTRDTLNLIKEMVDKGYMIPEYLQTDWASILGVFGSGKAAMALCYAPSWAPLQQATSDFPFSGPDYAAFAPTPGTEGGAYRSTISSGWINLIPSTAPNPELGYLFMIWSTSPAIDREMALTTLHNPMRSTTYEDADVQAANPMFEAIFAFPEGFYALPDYMHYEETQKILSDEMAAFISGSKNLEDTISKVCTDIEAKWLEYQ